MSRYLVTRANMLVFAALVALLALVGIVTYDRAQATAEARDRTVRSYEVLNALGKLGIAVRDAETGQRGFLLTGQDEYLAPYNRALDTIANLQAELQNLTADNPAQYARVRDMTPVVQRKLEELGQTIQLRRTSGLDSAMTIVRSNTGLLLQQDIEARTAQIRGAELSILAERDAAAASRGHVVRWLILLAVVLVAVTLGSAAWMLNRAWHHARVAEAVQRSLALRMQATLESLSQGVGVFSADNRLVQWNECFHQLLHLPLALLRQGTAYEALAAQCHENGVTLETESEIAHGPRGPDDAVTFERIGKDGHQLEIRRTASPDGGFVLTISDMTKRAQAEAVLRSAQRMEAIGQLTGGVAHDFNNLLTVILGNLDYVRGKLDEGDKLRVRIERGIWAAQRGATLTGHLLAFARKQPLAPAPIDLSATMPDLIPLLRRTLGEHIDVRYVDMPGLWPAMADPAQLESAILNLALNARDAMPGGGRLTIELANKTLDAEYAARHTEVTTGEYVMAAVSDTGHGIPADMLGRVFEPFFTTKPEGKGTGLGLAMVFGFIKQSGGHIKIYSEPGEGTVVRMYLPRAAAAAAAGHRIASPVELPRGNATILVVEDEPQVREIAVMILRDLGYRVLEAADGEEALRVFGDNASAINLLLTDVVLPGALRGRDVAERITAIRPGLKVLFMSGYTENSIVHHGRLDEGVQLIGKPFKREQLAQRVAEVLGAAPSPAATNVVPLKSGGGEKS